MIKCVLFDLDGTLLEMDEDKFTKIYLSSLFKKCFYDEDISFENFQKYMFLSLKQMINDDRFDITNYNKFFEIFGKYCPQIKFPSIINKIEDYYSSESFDACRIATKSNDLVIEFIKLLKEKNIKIAICTNPFFPSTAIKKRVQWAGLNIDDFEFITYSENYHYIKPNIKYYKEVLEHLNYKPDEILMVGNDMEEDMIASQLGINTFLITNHLISRYNAHEKFENKGDYEKFYNYLQENVLCK